MSHQTSFTGHKLLAVSCLALALTACGAGFKVDLPVPLSKPIDVNEQSIASLQEGLNQRRFTAEQVMTAYLAQIERHEPTYNAFTFLNTRALEQARDVDRRRARGEILGPLAGIPIVIKESIDVEGYASTAGWTLLQHQNLFPIKNAASAQRLIAAGAIVVGKGNIPAFSDDNTRANSSWAGPTYNSLDRDLVPGASSAGVATAVAAGFAAGGLAEETGGSIQSPAAAQSLVGIKPTFGLVPNTGVIPLGGSTRDVIGPIAGNVEDAAILLGVVAGYSRDDPKTAASSGRLPAGGYAQNLSKTSLRGKRIGLYGPGWRTQNLTPETQALYERAIRELEGRGATVVADPFAGSGFAELLLPDQYDYRGTESAAYDFNIYLQGVGISSLAALKLRIGTSPFDEGGPLRWYVDVLPVLRTSLDDPSVLPDLSEFNNLKANYLRIFNQVMDANRIDAMVFPHATDPLPKMGDGVAINETTVSAINIAGLPGITVPAGRYGGSGGPFSLIFVGRQWSEAALINMAYDYEQATGHRIKAALNAR